MICRQCRANRHNQCNGTAYTDRGRVDCPCWETHDYEAPDPELPDPYVTDAAEDAYYDSLIGERWTP